MHLHFVKALITQYSNMLGSELSLLLLLLIWVFIGFLLVVVFSFQNVQAHFKICCTNKAVRLKTLLLFVITLLLFNLQVYKITFQTCALLFLWQFCQMLKNSPSFIIQHYARFLVPKTNFVHVFSTSLNGKTYGTKYGISRDKSEIGMQNHSCYSTVTCKCNL